MFCDDTYHLFLLKGVSKIQIDCHHAANFFYSPAAIDSIFDAGLFYLHLGFSSLGDFDISPMVSE